jgi:hypothetical protein
MNVTQRIKHRLFEVGSYSAFKARSLRSSIRLALARPQPELSALQLRIVEELRASGYAMSCIDDLFADDAAALKAALEDEYEQFASSPTTEAAALRYSQAGSTRKEYLIQSFERGAKVAVHHPLVRFCHSEAVQNLLKSYFGEEPRLVAVNFWLTLPAVQEKRTGSQNWHRDHEDQRLVKIFIYLSDVVDRAGATEYIEGSFHGGRNDVIPAKRKFVLGDYLAEGDVEKYGLLSHKRVLTGPKWTVVFINTSGIHRGGFGKAKRGMANITFTSQASRSPCRFVLA